MVFEEMKDVLGLEENPVLTGLVDGNLRKLQRRRRERAAQMDPIREAHYQAVIASVMKALVGEKSGRAEVARCAGGGPLQRDVRWDATGWGSRRGAVGGCVPSLGREWPAVRAVLKD